MEALKKRAGLAVDVFSRLVVLASVYFRNEHEILATPQ